MIGDKMKSLSYDEVAIIGMKFEIDVSDEHTIMIESILDNILCGGFNEVMAVHILNRKKELDIDVHLNSYMAGVESAEEISRYVNMIVSSMFRSHDSVIASQA